MPVVLPPLPKLKADLTARDHGELSPQISLINADWGFERKTPRGAHGLQLNRDYVGVVLGFVA
jgi:hypothetical protein